MEIWEGSEIHSTVLFESLGSVNVRIASHMEDVVGGENLVYQVQILLVDDFLKDTESDCLVCLYVGGAFKTPPKAISMILTIKRVLILENLGLSAKRIEIILKYLLENCDLVKKVLLICCENIVKTSFWFGVLN